MPPPRCPLWPILANDRKRRAGLGWNPGPRSHSGQKGDEKKDERVLGVARTIKKRASARILAGSKLPEKRNNR